MGYNQLFLVKPSMEIIIKLINCFELEDLNDKTEFTHLDMDRNNTLCKIRELEEELAKYYLPCKKNIYLNKWTNKNCITICRQFLKTVDMTLTSREKYINSRKHLLYKLITTQEKDELKKTNGKIIITFD